MNRNYLHGRLKLRGASGVTGHRKTKMEKFVLKNRKSIIGFLTGALLLSIVLGPIGIVITTAQESDDITVTAEVAAWMDFEISKVAFDLGQLVEADGSLNIGSDSTAVELGTNAIGWTISVRGASDPAGLYSGEVDHTIPAVGSRQALSAGTNGYGVSVEDTYAGQTLTIPAAFVEAANTVGPITTGDVQIASHSAAVSKQEVMTFRVRAAAASTTPAAADYGDTITLTAAPAV